MKIFIIKFITFILLVIYVKSAQGQKIDSLYCWAKKQVEKLPVYCYKIKTPGYGFIGEPSMRGFKPIHKAKNDNDYDVRFISIRYVNDQLNKNDFNFIFKVDLVDSSGNRVDIEDEAVYYVNFQISSEGCKILPYRQNYYYNCTGIRYDIPFPYYCTQLFHLNKNFKINTIMVNGACHYAFKIKNYEKNNSSLIIECNHYLFNSLHFDDITYGKIAQSILDNDTIIKKFDWSETQYWDSEDEWLWSKMERKWPDGYLIMQCERVELPIKKNK